MAIIGGIPHFQTYPNFGMGWNGMEWDVAMGQLECSCAMNGKSTKWDFSTCHVGLLEGSER
jgi:hypothetical protein